MSSRLYTIKCKVCGNSFDEERELYEFDFTVGTCCPECGRDIELLITRKGDLSVRVLGIDHQFIKQ